MSIVAYLGAEAPEALTVTIEQGSSDLDLSTVSAASLDVYLPGATTPVTWTVGMSAQSSTSLTLTHVFAVEDLPATGRYVVVPLLTIPGGVQRCNPRVLNAQNIYEG